MKSLLAVAFYLFFFIYMNGTAQAASKYLAAWTSDQDGKESDFLAVIDADPKSPTYGKVVNTSTLPSVPGAHLLAVTGFNGTPGDLPSHRLNEAHHMNERLARGNKVFAGGLISGNVFSFDLRDPLDIPEPKLILSYLPTSRFSGPDDIIELSNGNLIATFMGSGGQALPPALTTPGGLVEFTPGGELIGNYDATLPNGPAHYRTKEDTGLLANPHGIDIREDLNLLITSDFADPVSLATSSETDQHQKFRSTIRIWDLNERRVRKVAQVPDGQRKALRENHEEPEGLMAVRMLHGKDKKGAFTASMSGGALYYSPDVTVEEPEFTQVFDFGPSSGVSVFALTKDDRYLILPISGILAPGEDGYDPKANTRRVVQLDISALVKAGSSFKCSGKDLSAADCPKIVSEVNADSEMNFETRGGPHVVALDTDDSRVAFVNYFVDLTHGFGLPGTGSCGDHRIYMLKREGDKLVVDQSFKDEVDGKAGINFNRIKWPHGDSGNAKPHGIIFR